MEQFELQIFLSYQKVMTSRLQSVVVMNQNETKIVYVHVLCSSTGYEIDKVKFKV